MLNRLNHRSIPEAEKPLLEPRPIQIGNAQIGSRIHGCRTFVVAELSCNHKQSLEYALQLVHAANWAGADAVKLQFTLGDNQDQDMKNLGWIIQNAGKCKVFISGGSKIPDDQVLQLAKVVKAAGAAGMAVGRNIWQRPNPVEFAKQIAKILFD